jgi:predicted nucleotide-binding protein (sugar kinase/HSP70/actin superfamily)
MNDIITFPHCRHTWIAAKAFFESLGIDVLVPLPISRDTEAIGAKYSPADACYPYKLTIGNMIETLEKGATVIFMAGGSKGACRLCYYAKLQERTLKKIGYDFRIIPANQPYEVFDIARKIDPDLSIRKICNTFSFVWKKLKAIEKVETFSRLTRPFEAEKGRTTKIKEKILKEIDAAQTIKKIKKISLNIPAIFQAIKSNPQDQQNILKIAILGEAYCVLEPFSNRNIEKKLGERGVLISQNTSEASWLMNAAKLNFPRWWIKNIVAPRYLKVPGGGEDQQSIGKAVIYGKKNYDGLILIQPRACMPENIAQMFLTEISQKYNIAFLALSFDENTSEIAMDNRIEAFIEMIKRKKLKKQMTA